MGAAERERERAYITIISPYRANCFFDIGMTRINFDDDDDDDDYTHIVFNTIY